jgi:hypothetical protein
MSYSEIWIYDVEILPNDAQCGFKKFGRDEYHLFQRADFASGRSIDTMKGGLRAFIGAHPHALFVSFNGAHYDDHVVAAMLDEENSPEDLYKLSSGIVGGTINQSPYKDPVGWHRLDLLQMMGGFHNVKELGIRLGHHRLQEMPYHYTHRTTEAESADVALYNRNDLQITEQLFLKLHSDFEMRQTLERDYRLPVGSLLGRHDAALGHKLVEETYKSLADVDRIDRPEIGDEWRAQGVEILDPRLTFPDAPRLQAVRDLVARKTFHFQLVEIRTPVPNSDGVEVERLVQHQTEKFEKEISFRGVVYTLGEGGLHSKDGPGMYAEDAETELLQVDVASMYPTLITELQIAPANLDGAAFTSAVAQLMKRRLESKKAAKAGDATAALIDRGAKVSLNSIFGKLKEAFSPFLDPIAGLRVTLNGQFILLTAIDRLTAAKCEILSANTDGLYLRCPRGLDVAAILQTVTADFGVVFEIDRLRKYYRTSVSNYLLEFADGKIKGGGLLRDSHGDIRKKGGHSIIPQAVVAYLIHGTPIEDTVRNCTDLSRFLNSFKAEHAYKLEDKDGNELPRILRWYETTAATGTSITKVKRADLTKRTKVSGVNNAAICLDLPAGLPGDIDFDYYIAEAKELAEKVLKPVATAAPKRKRKKKAAELLTEEQQAELAFRRNGSGVDHDKLAAIDLTEYRRDYAAMYKGSYQESMLGVLTKFALRHSVNADELYDRALAISDGVPYFGETADRVKRLRKMARSIALQANPFDADTIEPEEHKLHVHVYDNECGGGKTFAMTSDVVRSQPGSCWWWAIDHIDPIAAERKLELADAAQRLGIASPIDVCEVHSLVEGKGRIIERILARQHYIDAELARGSQAIFVTIVTHQSLLANDLEHVSGHVIIDEPIQVWEQRELRLPRSYRSIKDLLKLSGVRDEEVDGPIVEGDYKTARLVVTKVGKAMAEDDRNRDDSMFRELHWVVSQANRPNSRVYVPWDQFNALDENARNNLDVLVTLTPSHLAPFEKVFMAAAEFDTLFIKKIWEDLYGATFSKMDMSTSWQRSTPLSDRVTVFYALEHSNISKTSLSDNGKEQARNLGAMVAEFWKGQPFIWSTNKPFREAMALPATVVNKHGDTVEAYLSPRSNGINQYSNVHRACWLGAMKLPNDHVTIIKDAFGQDAKQMLLENYELYAVLQFVCRTNIRDFRSSEPCEFIVGDKAQAEFLKRIMKLPDHRVRPLPRLLDLPLSDQPAAKRGRKPSATKMTPDELREYQRTKKQESRAKLRKKDPAKVSGIVDGGLSDV